jgi:hypothetical protein
MKIVAQLIGYDEDGQGEVKVTFVFRKERLRKAQQLLLEEAAVRGAEMNLDISVHDSPQDGAK